MQTQKTRFFRDFLMEILVTIITFPFDIRGLQIIMYQKIIIHFMDIIVSIITDKHIKISDKKRITDRQPKIETSRY